MATRHTPSGERRDLFSRRFVFGGRAADPATAPLDPTIDPADSPRERFAESGELASNGWEPRDWGYGIGVRRDEYDFAAQHAAIIRAVARFGFGERTGVRSARPVAPTDEFDFASYPRGVRTWSEDHEDVFTRWGRSMFGPR